jgi:hypothetical protein
MALSVEARKAIKAYEEAQRAQALIGETKQEGAMCKWVDDDTACIVEGRKYALRLVGDELKTVEIPMDARAPEINLPTAGEEHKVNVAFYDGKKQIEKTFTVNGITRTQKFWVKA